MDESDLLSSVGELTENDLSGVDTAGIREMVLMPTDWTVGVLVDLLRKGKIDLSPNFQRRVAWDETKMSRYIESLFLGLPVPQIVLAENRPGKFLVIDGKQRLSALMFFAISDQQGSTLRLRGCEYRADLNGKTYDDLVGDLTLQDDVDFFDSQTIRTIVVKNIANEDLLYLLFLRLNQASVTLSPQELRRAMNPGGFYDWLDDWTGQAESLKVLVSRIPDFRMRDMELALRFLAFRFFLNQYNGNMKDFLDRTSAHFSDTWPQLQPQALGALEEMSSAIDATVEIFGRGAFRIWLGDRYQSSRNRAVFDIMTYYFRDARILAESIVRREQVVAAFKSLCETDNDFLKYLQSSTKTREATEGRLSKWNVALQQATGLQITAPPSLTD